MSTHTYSNSSNQESDAVEEVARHVADAAGEALDKGSESARDAGKAVSEQVKEGVRISKGYAQRAADVTKDAAHQASDTAKDMYHSASLKTGETMEISKQFVRRNPVYTMLGAVAFGLAIGCIIMRSRRNPTFSERFVDDPLDSVRNAIATALAPAAQRVHNGYDSARGGIDKVLDSVHDFGHTRSADTLANRINRAGSKLRFW